MIQLHCAWNSKELHRPPQSSLHTRVYCCCAHNSKEREPVSSFISRQVGEDNLAHIHHGTSGSGKEK